MCQGGSYPQPLEPLLVLPEQGHAAVAEQDRPDEQVVWMLGLARGGTFIHKPWHHAPRPALTTLGLGHRWLPGSLRVQTAA